MHSRYFVKCLTSAFLLILLFTGCSRGMASARIGSALPSGAGSKGSGDPAYEALTVRIEGVRELDGGVAEVSVADLRALPQHELDASYKRTTGLNEEFFMTGPLLKDVIAKAGGDIDAYEGLGMIGRDSYYCLFSREVIDNTPDLMLAVTVDGKAKLDDDTYPAWAAVQGQFGPY
ncbi:MAG: hypothetical protein FWF83_08015, partial [Clostridiales bacterium]|nr:hypothetical protein [Clostridiales bacterium]